MHLALSVIVGLIVLRGHFDQLGSIHGVFSIWFQISGKYPTDKVLDVTMQLKLRQKMETEQNQMMWFLPWRDSPALA